MTAIESRLLEALRALGNRATPGDLAQRAALATHEVEANILAALSHVGGHVAVDEHGNLVYSIARTRPLPRFEPGFLARVGRFLAATLRGIFFAALTLVLVVYFVCYIVLIVAVIVAGIAAAAKGSDCDCNCDCKVPSGCGGCGGCDACCDGMTCHGFNRAGDTLYRKTVARGDPMRTLGRDALRKVQAQARIARHAMIAERAKARAARLQEALSRLRARRRNGLDFPLEVETVSGKPPFLRAVHAFVFGPPRPPHTTTDAERMNILGFLRDHGGRITATDATLLTGLPRAAADRLLLDVAVAHGGDVEVSEDGAVVYTFERFVVSAGADTDTLSWISRRRDGRVSVSDFAREKEIGAQDALARLELLAALAGARVEHGTASEYVFDQAALARLRDAAREHGALRDYQYAWEKLERSPAILGVPAGGRGWIWGFNTLNLVVSGTLVAYYASGNRVVGELFGFMSPELELWSLGIVPLALSASVFVIPLVRWIGRAIADGGRERRNLRRIMLLGLAHRLQSGPTVTAASIRVALDCPAAADGQIERQLTRLGVDLEATLDPEGELVFDVAHRELAVVALHAGELDPATLGIKPIVYDTSKPDVTTRVA